MTEPIATVKQGQLKGVTDTDLNGKIYYKFLGIPYAKPPIGSLRFKAPQPAETWTEVRDASKDGSPCLSVDIFTRKAIGSEDCLYLNVFTNELPNTVINPKPVMVFIHGGGFTVGSNSEPLLGGKHLIAEDVVLVTINYRLGVFGFLSSDDVSLNIPGNAGLKDQTFALKWVQENISSFNGDPNNVTIFGSSAGGAAVQFQVLSPSSKGLFHKAIAQSGSALNTWAWGQKNVIQVAELLGTKASNEKDALDVIMNTDANELYTASLKIPDVLLDATKRRPYGPVIEQPNPTAFLTENPTDLLMSGRFNQVPLIIGAASNEGMIAESGALDGNIKLEEIGLFWSLDVEEYSQQHAELKAKINNVYFKDGETSEARQEIFGDVCFLIGITHSAKLAARTSQNPVYLYIFTYKEAVPNDMLKLFGLDESKFKGVAHGAEQKFLFNMNMPGIPETVDPTALEQEKIAIKKVTKIWADFARTGRPHELWEPVTDGKDLKYFDINQDPQLKVNPFPERVTMWEEVFKSVPIDARLQEKPAL